MAAGDAIDAIVLDLMLPGRDGMSLLRELRTTGFTKPILILSRVTPSRTASGAWTKGPTTT